MRRKISDLVVVITGASSGIGRATALQLAEQGAAVVLASCHEEVLKEAAQDCKEAGGCPWRLEEYVRLKPEADRLGGWSLGLPGGRHHYIPGED